MKYEPGWRWTISMHPSKAPGRTDGPLVLDLEAAVRWVQENRPILWVGSIFSVPPPSALPSGYAVSHSLAHLLIPRDERIPEQVQETSLQEFATRWPLEVLLDEFASLNLDLSTSLLNCFNQANEQAAPNPLHYAVAEYYSAGLSNAPFCVTSNWDTLLEKAFRERGYSVRISGPADHCAAQADNAAGEKSLCILHPHGSFETRDVVCSHRDQVAQLPLTPQWIGHPTLFIGYSGYEPSLYRLLEYPSGQLWCVRSEDDFKIPAKRRLLFRPNTFVYIGDMRNLLKALGVLREDVDLTTPYPHLQVPVPPKVLDVIRLGIAAALHPAVCAELLPGVLIPDCDEPEATFRYTKVIRALENHTRNRLSHPAIPISLMAAARFRNHERLWMDLLAYMMRFAPDLPSKVTGDLFRHAASAVDELERVLPSAEEQEVKAEDLIPILMHMRTRCYKCYLGMPEGDDDIKDSRQWLILSEGSAHALGDLALAGEMVELSGFACARDGDLESAQGYLDTAATYYYMAGLWNGGQVMEWAAKNIQAVQASAAAASLALQVEET